MVCDLVFDQRSAFDKELKKSITNIEGENKIILAYNKYFINKNQVFYDGIQPSSFGEVTKLEKDSPFYFTHQLVSEENIPSLPFQMHLRLSGNSYKEHECYLLPKMVAEKDKKNNYKYAFNEYITELRFIDEKSLYNDSVDNTITQNTFGTVNDTSLIHSNPGNFFNLGYACTDEGQLQILDAMRYKSGNNKNIVMIGNFNNENFDKHQTAYGILGGTTILLNEFFQIHYTSHSLTSLEVASYVVSLFFCFCIVLTVFFKRVFNERKYKSGGNTKLQTFLYGYNLISNIVEFVLDEIHFLVLFALTLLINLIFHITINVLGLLYYFLLFNALLKFFIRKVTNNTM